MIFEGIIAFVNNRKSKSFQMMMVIEVIHHERFGCLHVRYAFLFSGIKGSFCYIFFF